MRKYFRASIYLAIGSTLLGCNSLSITNTNTGENVSKATLTQETNLAAHPNTLSKIKQEYIERFGVQNVDSIRHTTDESLAQELVRLSEQVSTRYKEQLPADIYKFQFSNVTYVDRPHHYAMRPMNVTIARGDTIVSQVKSNDFINNGVNTTVRFTLSDNLYLYLNGKLVDRIYKGGAFDAYAQLTQSKRLSAMVHEISQ